MGQTRTECSNCAAEFNPKENPASKRLASLGGAGAGGILGTKFGIAGGILGASVAYIAALPAAVLGLVIGLLFDSMYVKCPECEESQFV